MLSARPLSTKLCRESKSKLIFFFDELVRVERRTVKNDTTLFHNNYVARNPFSTIKDYSRRNEEVNGRRNKLKAS